MNMILPMTNARTNRMIESASRISEYSRAKYIAYPVMAMAAAIMRRMPSRMCWLS